MNPDDVGWLTERLETGPIGVRQGHVEALGRSRDPGAAAPLCGILDDTELGEAAAQALVRLGAAAVPSLCEAVKQGRGDARWRAARALGAIRDSRALDTLREASVDPDWRVRRESIKALARMGDRRAVEPLCEALNDSDWRVRAEAVKGLGGIGDARAVLPLIGVLQRGGTETAERAAAALGALGDARAVLPLCEAFRAGNEEAVWALAKIAEADPVPELRAAVPVLWRRLLLLSLLNTPDSREMARAFWGVLQSIRSATARAQDLPFPAAAPPPSEERLPVPSGPPQPPVDSLPAPARVDAHTSAGIRGASAARGSSAAPAPASAGDRPEERMTFRSWRQCLKQRLSRPR